MAEAPRHLHVRRAGTPGLSVVPAALREARERSEDLRTRCKAELTRMRQDALTSLSGEREVAHQLARQRALDDLQEELPSLLETALRHLLERELRTAPEHIRQVVENLVNKSRSAAPLELWLHPDDARRLGPSEALAASVGLQGGLYLHEDPDVRPGGCLLRSAHGLVDAQVETRLDSLLAQLTRERE